MIQLGHCLCDVVEHFDGSDNRDAKVDLTEALDWIYQLAGEESTLSQRILCVLKLDNRPVGEIGNSECVSQRDKILGCMPKNVKNQCELSVETLDQNCGCMDKENQQGNGEIHCTCRLGEKDVKGDRGKTVMPLEKLHNVKCVENSNYVIDTQTLQDLQHIVKLSD